MKKARLFFFLLTLMLSFCTGKFAFAGAFSMGQLQAVSSDGSLDVVRNPSIMTAQRETNSIGFILLSTPYYLRRYSYDSYLNTWINDARVHDTKYITGSVYLSYCRKVGKGAIGIAVDTDNPYQGLYAEYERSVAGVMTGSIYYELVRGDFMKVSPRFVFSFGSVVAGNHSIGVQIAAGYTRKKDDYGFISSTNSAFLAKNHASMRMEGVSAELVVGYSYRDPDSQIGLMIRSGRFSWQKTRIYYTMADFSATLFFAGSVSEPFAMQYDRGLSMTAGGYRRLGSYIAVALEGEYEIPVSYGVKELRCDEFTGFFGITNNLAVNKKGRYIIRGGIEVLPSGPVTIALGGSVSTTRERRSSNRFKEHVNIDRYGGSFGLDFRFTPSILITMGSQLGYTHERKRIAASYDYINSRSLDGLARYVNIDTFIIASFGF